MTPVSRPWYREPMWILALALPALTVPAGLATYALAARGDNSPVIDEVQRAGQMQHADLAADVNAARQGLSAQAEIDRHARRLRLRLSGIDAPRLHLRLAHPTLSARDVDLWLDAVSPGQYEIATGEIDTHAWNAVLESPEGEWRLVGRLARDEDRLALTPAVRMP